MTSLPTTDAGPQPIYTGRATNWPMVASTCIGGLLVVLMGRQANGPWADLTVPLVLAAVGVLINILTASTLRVTAGPRGFTFHWGPFGWPRSTYRLDEIERAEVIDLPWWRVSWGLWWTPKRTCCTVRSGPTVRLVLRNRRTVTVTVPDPVAAVAVLDQSLNQRRG